MGTDLSFFMDTARPGSRYLLLGLLFLRITLFLLVWKNGDRAVRWLAGRHTPVGDLELKELRGELFDVFILSEFMVLGNAVPRLAAHGPEFAAMMLLHGLP